MDAQYVPSLRAVLVVLFAGSLLSQALLPRLAEELGGPYDETVHLVAPYAVAGILVIGCAQVALITVWRLLSMVADDTIFTARALRWVDVITISGAAAALISAGVAAHLLVIVGVGGPAIVFALIVSVAGGIGFVLLMSVMRDRLRSAIACRSERDTVI